VNRVFSHFNADSGKLFRVCGFVGGLTIERPWALSLATDKYDGTLYYQIYLAAHAFTGKGIGYIASPIVAGRTGNSPLFGAAQSEKAAHIPGTYTPKGRAAMWRGVLRICADVEATTSIPLMLGVRKELSGRQSFHVFEMISLQGRKASISLAREFHKIDLMRHPLAWIVFLASVTFGRSTSIFFRSARRRLQRN